MDISAILLACSVHADDQLLASIAYVQGQGSPTPYAVMDVSPKHLELEDALGLDQTPVSATGAQAAVKRILDSGGEPVVGLLPVRVEWASEFGLTWSALLDGCANVQVASAKLSEIDHGCRAKGRRIDAPARRNCTLQGYGASLGLPALRRAVLADLTLPAPSFTDVAPGAAAAMTLRTTDELFFPIAPLERASSDSFQVQALKDEP